MTHKVQTRISAAWLPYEWITSCSLETAAACDGKYFFVNQIMYVLVLLDFSHFPSLYLQQKSQKFHFLFTFAFLLCNQWILSASIKFKLWVTSK